MVPGSWTDRPATNLVLLDEVGLAGPFIKLVKKQGYDGGFTMLFIEVLRCTNNTSIT